MPSNPSVPVSVVVLVIALLSGCAGGAGQSSWREGAPRPSIDGPGDLRRAGLALSEPVRNLPKSRIGNSAGYTVFGQRYAILDTAADFREEGIASWYGAKFHGRDTSSGERYDMHGMTAAHKHLPLPTFVRVTRTDTGQSIVVKVNDRGPFADDRIIDLSYGAAHKLDMLGSGTAPVTIEALSTHVPAGTPIAAASALEGIPVNAPGAVRAPVAAVQVSDSLKAQAGDERWIQVGAYRDDANARRALQRVAGHTGLAGRVELDAGDDLYRVRLGPVADGGAIDSALQALASAGVESYTMVPVAR